VCTGDWATVLEDEDDVGLNGRHRLEQRLLRARQRQRVPIKILGLGGLVVAQEEHGDIGGLRRRRGPREVAAVRIAVLNLAGEVGVALGLLVADVAAALVADHPATALRNQQRRVRVGQRVLAVVCNSDTFRVSEMDSTNRESITILHCGADSIS